jgi:hypothetical protein
MNQRVFGRKTRPARKSTQQDAWIAIDGSFAVRHCTVLDVSSGGVRLRLDDPDFTARQFHLKFARAGKGRLCKIAWRRGREIGAEFVT